MGVGAGYTIPHKLSGNQIFKLWRPYESANKGVVYTQPNLYLCIKALL
jgi:hypothetical protein